MDYNMHGTNATGLAWFQACQITLKLFSLLDQRIDVKVQSKLLNNLYWKRKKKKRKKKLHQLKFPQFRIGTKFHWIWKSERHKRKTQKAAISTSPDSLYDAFQKAPDPGNRTLTFQYLECFIRWINSIVKYWP